MNEDILAVLKKYMCCKSDVQVHISVKFNFDLLNVNLNCTDLTIVSSCMCCVLAGKSCTDTLAK